MEYDVTKRANITKGMLVEIVDDTDKEGELVRGFVSEVISKQLSKAGIKVSLTNGKVGHIKRVVGEDEFKRDNFKFWNIFFYEPKIYSIWDNKDRKYMVICHKNKNSGKLENTCFLFDNEKSAREFLNKSSLEKKRYVVNPINRKKPIVENFRTLDIDYYRVNLEKKISEDKLKELEYRFKKMK